MASRSTHLVLRDLRTRPARAALPGARSGVSRAVQLLLQRSRRQASAIRARHALASRPRAGARLSSPCRRRHRHPARRGARAAARGADRAWPAPRAAAPGADPHGCEAPVVAQSDPTRVPEAMAADADPCARAALDRFRWRPVRDRPWRCWFLLRQRDAAPSRVARALPDRLAPRDARRLHPLHRRWRLSPARAVARRRLGSRGDLGMAGAAVLAGGGERKGPPPPPPRPPR